MLLGPGADYSRRAAVATKGPSAHVLQDVELSTRLAQLKNVGPAGSFRDTVVNRHLLQGYFRGKIVATVN